MTVSSPLWFRLILFVFSARYRKRWADLDKRSRVTGVAREEVELWTCGGYRLVVNRESRKRDA